MAEQNYIVDIEWNVTVENDSALEATSIGLGLIGEYDELFRFRIFSSDFTSVLRRGDQPKPPKQFTIHAEYSTSVVASTRAEAFVRAESSAPAKTDQLNSLKISVRERFVEKTSSKT